MTDLPPWHARNERDRKEMKEWLFRELHQMRVEEAERAAQETEMSITLQLAIYSAIYGRDEAKRMQPLRAMYPPLALFLQPPKGRRGMYRRSRPKAKVQAELAAGDVHRIRAIWKKHYGRQNRGRDDISAEAIAAEFHGLSEDEVVIALKHPK